MRLVVVGFDRCFSTVPRKVSCKVTQGGGKKLRDMYKRTTPQRDLQCSLVRTLTFFLFLSNQGTVSRRGRRETEEGYVQCVPLREQPISSYWCSSFTCERGKQVL